VPFATVTVIVVDAVVKLVVSVGVKFAVITAVPTLAKES
jgi:hypothetical protein